MRLTVCSIALLLAVNATAAPSLPANPPPTPASVSIPAQAHASTATPAVKAVQADKVTPKVGPGPGVEPAAPDASVDGSFQGFKAELKRLMIGNQAGIIKVLGPNRQGVAYARGIDDQSLARFNDESCGNVLSAMGLEKNRVVPLVQHIMINYATLPHKESVALLSVAACSPAVDAAMRQKAEQFLLQVMETDKDVHARRQAILALAVQQQVTPETAERVLAKYEKTENLWETFPVQQFFQYHAPQLRKLQNFALIRQRIAAVNSLYTPAILGFLDQP